MKITNMQIYWFGGWLFDFTKFVTILVFITLIVHYFFYTIFIVNGESMEPNFHDGDIVLVNRIDYRLREPSRQDPIALYFPGEIEKKYIKRIIGLPNDQIEIRNGAVYTNKAALKENYTQDNNTTPDMKVTLGVKEYFVLGDNRTVSSDSRIWGTLPQYYIIGLAEDKIGNTHNIGDIKAWGRSIARIPEMIWSGINQLLD